MKVGRTLSRPIALLAGTPQGSVLSPTLYNIFVNDIPLRQGAFNDGAQFADDVSAWCTARLKRTALARLQLTLKDLEPWLYKWRIKINVSKTQLVCFGQMGAGSSLNFCGKKVKESNSLKILGTTYDKMGRATTHCKEIAARAMSRVNLLRRLRGRSWGTNGQRLLMFYKQFVRPVMENGYAYTATAKTTALKPLQVVQNSALRIILKADRKTRIQDLERRTGIPPIQQRLQQLKDGTAERYANSPLLARLHTRKNLLQKK